MMREEVGIRPLKMEGGNDRSRTYSHERIQGVYLSDFLRVGCLCIDYLPSISKATL